MKKIYLTCIGIFLLFLLTSCNALPNYIIADNMIKFHSLNVADFGFNISLITTSKDANIEFVSFFGQNAQTLTVNFVDETYDDIKNLKHNGYFIRLLGFICHSNAETVQINGVNLKIDGQEKQVVFKTPLVNTIKKETEDSAIQFSTGFPIIVMTNSFNVNTYRFPYYVDEDVVLDNFEFNDFLTLNNATIAINDVEQGALKDILPLELKKGSNIEIRGTIDFKNKDNSSYYDNVYCSSILTYRTKSGKVEAFIYDIACQGVSNEEDAKAVIDILRNKER